MHSFSSVVVRDATLQDVSVLAQANCAMAWETEQKTLELNLVTDGVSTLLQDEHKGRYLVIEGIANDDQGGVSTQDSAQVLGQLMLTKEWSDWRNRWFWWIQSVYIWPHARRQGFYKMLYDEVKRQVSAADGVCGIRLYVERENEDAQRTYEALGMKESGYRFYEWMSDANQDDAK
ncbi:MAG: GNAT family N-acetyltransferase [Deltaproteobacteria bacterium]|nr:GNAT family N-acetyltransferase [Deltaproteobacteria bacterium]